jgi:tRNA nucleotidyltransferase (CCA-adding enzyme)
MVHPMLVSSPPPHALPPLDPTDSADARAVVTVAERVAARGGRALLVGGYVRDLLLARLGRGQPSKDLDVEVFGLTLEALRAVLATLGAVDAMGVSFAVLRIRGIDCDFSLPRRDRKDGAGHRGFLVSADPFMSVADAARRRDFTINSVSLDPLTGVLLDPVGGVADLGASILRATDPDTFGEDPLRALRAVQMAARFALTPDGALPALMARQDLRELPAERLEQELRKLLLRGAVPSRGLSLLRDGGCVAALPGLEAPDHLWRARSAALDRWVPMRQDRSRLALAEGWALLTLGASIADREALFARVRPPLAVQAAVAALVAEPAGPGLLPASPPEVRRLARALAPAGVTVASWLRVRRARGLDVDGAERLAVDAGVRDGPLPDAVMGRHLLARGMEPGPAMGALLAACREVQDDTGLRDVDAILARAAES